MPSFMGMILLAGIVVKNHNHLGRYLLTGFGLGLLIGVTLTMAGVYRGMVDDAKVLLRAGGADIWVVQQNTPLSTRMDGSLCRLIARWECPE